jgi:hypothetical protein
MRLTHAKVLNDSCPRARSQPRRLCCRSTGDGGLIASSYDGPAAADGVMTTSKLRMDEHEVSIARTIAIVPRSYAASTSATDSREAAQVIANAIDRSLDIRLNDYRFECAIAGTRSEPLTPVIRDLLA